jgi:hypothetical protein
MSLIQDRLEHLEHEGPFPDDLRRRAVQEIARREGQALFRKLLLTREIRCAVTGTAVECCLQAAHIYTKVSRRLSTGSLIAGLFTTRVDLTANLWSGGGSTGEDRPSY